MNFLENYKKCFYGQAIAICFALFQYISESIPYPNWIFTKLFIFFTFLIIANGIIIFVTAASTNGVRAPLANIFYVSITEVLINIFMLKAIENGPIYYVIALNQLCYPITIMFKKYVRKEKEDITILKLLSFIFIIVFCFCISFFSSGKFFFSWVATLYVILANFLITVNLYIQYKIIQKYHINYFSIIMSLMGLPVGLIISSSLDYKNIITPKSFFNFYLQNIRALVLFAICLTAVYIISPPFIKRYSPVSFQASLLAVSPYIGLMCVLTSLDRKYFSQLISIKSIGEFFTMENLKNYDKILSIILYLICILSSFYLTYSTNVSADDEEIKNQEDKDAAEFFSDFENKSLNDLKEFFDRSAEYKNLPKGKCDIFDGFKIKNHQ